MPLGREAASGTLLPKKGIHSVANSRAGVISAFNKRPDDKKKAISKLFPNRSNGSGDLFCYLSRFRITYK
jgi:hypothetical protein